MEEYREGLESALQAAETDIQRKVATLVALSASYSADDNQQKAREWIQKATDGGDRSMCDQWLQSCVSYQEGMIQLRKQPSSIPQARICFNRIERSNPNFTLHQLGFASICLEDKDYRNAFTRFKQVLEALGSLAPPITRVGMALCCLHLKKINHARKCLDRAVALDNEDVLALRVLIAVAIEQKDVATVTSTTLALHNLTPEDPVVIQRYVDSLYFKASATGKLSNAKVQGVQNALIGKAEEASQGYETLLAYCTYQRARLAHATEKIEEAKELYQTAIKMAPELYAARIGLTKVLWKLNESDAAFEMLRELHRLIPDDNEVAKMLSIIYSNRGQHEEASRLAQAIVNTGAAADPEAWHLNTYVNRLDANIATKYLDNALDIQRADRTDPSLESRTNRASLTDDLNDLSRIIRDQFKTDEVAQLIKKEDTTRVQSLPMLINYARLLAPESPQEARKLCVFLLKNHSSAPEPLFLLHNIAVQEKREKEAITWLSLLFAVDNDNPFATSEIAKFFLDGDKELAGQRAYNTTQKQKHLTRNSIFALSRGIIYLREAKRRGQISKIADAMTHFRGVLDDDRGNIAAAHGLACCIAMIGMPNAATTLFSRVVEAHANDEGSQVGARLHSVSAEIMSGAYRSGIALAKNENSSLTSKQNSELAFANLYLHNFDTSLDHLERAITRAKEAGGEGGNNSSSAAELIGLLQYNKAIVLTTVVVDEIRKATGGLAEDKGKELGAKLKEAVHCAKAAANTKYKNDGQAAVLFVKELLSEMKTLEKERLKAVARGNELRRKDTVLDEEWREQAEEAERERERETQRIEQENEQRRQEKELRAQASYNRVLQLTQMGWAAEEPMQEGEETGGDIILGDGDDIANAFDQLHAGGADFQGDEEIDLGAAMDAAAAAENGFVMDEEGEDIQTSRSKRGREDEEEGDNNNGETGAAATATDPTLNVN